MRDHNEVLLIGVVKSRPARDGRGFLFSIVTGKNGAGCVEHDIVVGAYIDKVSEQLKKGSTVLVQGPVRNDRRIFVRNLNPMSALDTSDIHTQNHLVLIGTITSEPVKDGPLVHLTMGTRIQVKDRFFYATHDLIISGRKDKSIARNISVGNRVMVLGEIDDKKKIRVRNMTPEAI